MKAIINYFLKFFGYHLAKNPVRKPKTVESAEV